MMTSFAMQSEDLRERQESQRKMTRAEAGRKGGMKTRQRYGNEFFRKIGQIGGKKGGARLRSQ